MRDSNPVAYIAVADVYKTNADTGRAWAGTDARSFSDFRKLLELKGVDAVRIATPDHWHATAAALACEAGKDVYVEKPTSLTIREGRAKGGSSQDARNGDIVWSGDLEAPPRRELERLAPPGDCCK